MNQTLLRQLLWLCFTIEVASSYVVTPDFDQCDRPQCTPVDDILTDNVNFDIEPCDDFFNYACGKNVTRNVPLRLKLSSDDTYPTENQNVERLRDVLRETYRLQGSEKEIRSLEIERQIYAKCKSKNAYNEREWIDYEAWLGEAARLDPDRPYNTNKDRWFRAEMKYATEGFGFSFFDLNIVERENAYDREVRRYIQISPPSDSALDLSNLLIMRYTNKLPSGRHGQRFNYDRRGIYSSLSSFIDRMNTFLSRANDDLGKEERVPEPMFLHEWQKKYNNLVGGPDGDCKYDWIAALKEYVSTLTRTFITDYEYVIVTDENYFKELANVMCLQKKEVIENYVYLRVISKTIGLVDREYRDKYSIIPPAKEFKNECTPGLLIGAAHAYLDKYFPPDNQVELGDIFKSVKGIIESQLGSELYNSQATSYKTRNFLDQLKKSEVIIGYPNWLANRSLASDIYGNFQPGDSYLKNQLHILKNLCKTKLKALRDYSIPIIDLNTYFKSFNLDSIEFSSNLKQIILPMGVFSENSYKLLSSQLYDPINYGAAGTAIATELYYQWLIQSAYAKNASLCISTQMPRSYDKVQTTNYITRATAYLLGLHASYLAWPSRDSYPIEFRRFGAITDFRLFFLSFAQSMCRTTVPMEDMLPRHFINFVVANLYEFTNAFKCFDSHVLNRKHKCDPLKPHQV